MKDDAEGSCTNEHAMDSIQTDYFCVPDCSVDSLKHLPKTYLLNGTKSLSALGVGLSCDNMLNKFTFSLNLLGIIIH